MFALAWRTAVRSVLVLTTTAAIVLNDLSGGVVADDQPGRQARSTVRALPGSPAAMDHFGRGERLRTAGRLREAITQYGLALAADGDFAATYKARASALRRLGDHSRALADYDRVQALDAASRGDPHWDADTSQRRASVLMLLKRFEDAEDELDRLIERDPRDTRALDKRGMSRSYLKKYDGAIADLNRAIELNPDETLYYLHRGCAAADMGDSEMAARDFTRVLQSWPDDVATLARRAIAYQKLDRYDRAFADNDRAIALAPGRSALHHRRGYCREKLGDQQGAMADYNEAIRLDPRSLMSYINRADEFIQRRDFTHALADIEKAIALKPEHYFGYLSRAMLQLKMGQMVEALADTEKALRLRPDSWMCRWTRGFILFAKDERERAFEDMCLVIESRPTNASAYFIRAVIRLERVTWDQRIMAASDLLQCGISLLADRSNSIAIKWDDELETVRVWVGSRGRDSLSSPDPAAVAPLDSELLRAGAERERGTGLR